ncbi:hypothetical protein PIROE2DRAFT_59228 [Piromyces sp. E2]|nr:hypothetical protein PIROE2DRAFT_59228 [Piromyces sp. E2]|eukprot:OUM66633.1 hypothetical protein PIROE2DRAFT_59228 [Piromyces sp. E2]
MMKLSKIEKIGQPPIFPDNDVETYFIPSSHSPKKNTIKNQNNSELNKNDIPITSIIPSEKIELDENLSFMCEPIYKPSFFFSKKAELNKDYKEENNDTNDDNNEELIIKEKDENGNQKSMIKSKSTDSIVIRKKELEKRNKKGESLLKNSIKDLRNCYDNSLSSSKSKIKKKTTKTMKKSNSSILASSILNSSSTTLTRNSSYEPEKDELKKKNSVQTPNEKKKIPMKKPINYLRSNSKSSLNTKSRYLSSSNSNNKIRKEKSTGDDGKIINKKKGSMNVSLPLSISIPYSSNKKVNKPSSKGQKNRNSDTTTERKSVSSKGKSGRKRIKSIPLNISLSVSAPNIDNASDENLSSNNSVEEDGFDSSYCNNSFNNYDHNLPNNVQYCNPDNENEDNESNITNKNNYIIENIIVNNENEQIFSPSSRLDEEKEITIEIKNDNNNQNLESEKELQRQDFFSNLGHNKMNYSSSETDKMYYYSINDNEDDKTIYYKNYDQDEENKENSNQNKKIINKNINNIIQKSKKNLLKKTGNNIDMWSIKSEPIDYSENENKKNITYNMPPDYSMIPSSPPRSENLIPSAPPSMHEDKQELITNEIIKETKNIARSIISIKSLCSNKKSINNDEGYNSSSPLINKNTYIIKNENLEYQNQNSNNILQNNVETLEPLNDYIDEENDNINFINKDTDNNSSYNNNYNISNNNNNEINNNININNNIRYNLNQNYKSNDYNKNVELYNQQLLPQQPMTEYNDSQNKTNNIQNLQAAHLPLNPRKLTPLYHNKYMNDYNMNYINDINNNIYQYEDTYNYNSHTYRAANNNNNNINITSNNIDDNKKNKKHHHYNRHMKLKHIYEPLGNEINEDNDFESLEDEPIDIKYKRNILTRNSSYMLYTTGQDEHLVKLRIPKLDPKVSYVPNTTILRNNHPDLGKVKDVYNYFKNDHQPIEKPTNSNEFFQQLLNTISKPKFVVTIVGKILIYNRLIIF